MVFLVGLQRCVYCILCGRLEALGLLKKKMFDFQSSVPLIPFRPLLNRISGYYIYLLTVHDLLTMPRFSAVLD